jgi:hypothetical protein
MTVLCITVQWPSTNSWNIKPIRVNWQKVLAFRGQFSRWNQFKIAMWVITQLLVIFTTTKNILIVSNWNIIKAELFKYRINPEPFFMRYSREYKSTRMLRWMLFGVEMLEHGLAGFALGMFLKS